MSKAFRRAKGALVVSFHPAEAELLRSLVTQLLELLGVGEGTSDEEQEADPLAAAIGFDTVTERPDDPVLLRLFPDAYRKDDRAAEEFRRFTERGLRDRKAGLAVAVLASLDSAVPARTDRVDVRVDPPTADAWLRTLTDLRLALGTRLGVEQDDEARWRALPDDDPLAHVHDVYEWLGWLQETLVQALSRPSPTRRRG